MLKTLGGLPAHPLFVHFAVVLPLVTATLALIWAFTSRKVSNFTAVLAGISALFTALAHSSGERLATRLGHPEDNLGPVATHATDAKFYLVASIILSAALLAGFTLETIINEKTKGAELATKIIAVVTSIAVAITGIMVGHNGAKLTWQDTTPSSNNVVQITK